METINGFSPEVCNELKYYVYRLIDPRNGQTFYVGKGKYNRVFAHANDALKDCDLSEEEDTASLKLKTIRNIRREGLDVIYLIHSYGLDEVTAYEVEAAVIDCFQGLTNLVNGHYGDRGVTNALTLQHNLSVETYTEPDNLKYMLIKTKWDRVNQLKEENPELSDDECIYRATRCSWRIDPQKARQYEYVIGVIDGIVQGVYKVKDWKLSDNGVRYEFDKDDNVSSEIVEHFLKKRIPDTYTKKGMASPVLYHN